MTVQPPEQLKSSVEVMPVLTGKYFVLASDKDEIRPRLNVKGLTNKQGDWGRVLHSARGAGSAILYKLQLHLPILFSFVF